MNRTVDEYAITVKVQKTADEYVVNHKTEGSIG
jgi:hypothetical protein